MTDSIRLRQALAFFSGPRGPSTNRPERSHQLHKQLALRAAGRHRATGEAVVRRGSASSCSGRNLGDGVVVCVFAERRRRTGRAEIDPLGMRHHPFQQRRSNTSGRSALILLQMSWRHAHYGVEGDAFMAFPRSGCRTVWPRGHVQLGLFGSPIAWLAAGIVIGPLVSEQEPMGQRLRQRVVSGLAASWSGSLTENG